MTNIKSNITTNATNVNVSDLISTNISIENLGIDNANNVKVNYNISDGFEYISSNDTNVIYDPINRILTWDIGLIQDLEVKMLNVILKAISPGNKVLNVSSTTDTYDTNLSNNNASLSININPASDIVTKVTTNNSNPNVNEFLTIIANNTNLGPSNATNVKTNITIPEGFEYISTDNPNAIYDPINRIITLTTGLIEPNISNLLNVVLKAIQEGTQTINSTTTNDNYDPNEENNNAYITIDVKQEQSQNNTNTINTSKVNAKNTKTPLKEAGIPVGILVILLLVGVVLRIKR